MTTVLFVVAVSTGAAILITLILGLSALVTRTPRTAQPDGPIAPARVPKVLRILLPLSLIVTLALGGVLIWMLLVDADGRPAADAAIAEPTKTPTAAADISLEPAGEDDILVIVAAYEDRSDGAYQGEDIASALVRQINNLLPGDETGVRVELYPEVISSAAEAVRVLEETNGLLLVYGWHDGVGVEAFQVFNSARIEELMNLPNGAWENGEHFNLGYTIESGSQKDFLANYILGMGHALQKDFQSALVYFSLAGDLDEITADSEVAKHVFLWLGYVHGGLNETELAVSDTTKAIELDPSFSWAYTNRAGFYINLWEYQLAVQDLDTALELLPEDVLSYAYRGLAFQGLGETELAFADFATAIELDADYGLTYALRGFTYDALGLYEQAISDFDTAIELDPDTAFFWAYRGKTYFDLGDFNQAIDDFSTSIELDEEYLWAFASRGLVYYYQGKYRLAILDFDRTLALDPTYAWGYGTRGLVYHDLGEYSKAIDDYTRAIELDAAYAWAYASRGWSYYAIGQTDDALVDLSTAIELGPTYAWAYFTRGYVYETLGEYEKAIWDYEMAIKLAPDEYCYLSETHPELTCP